VVAARRSGAALACAVGDVADVACPFARLSLVLRPSRPRRRPASFARGRRQPLRRALPRLAAFPTRPAGIRPESPPPAALWRLLAGGQRPVGVRGVPERRPGGPGHRLALPADRPRESLVRWAAGAPGLAGPVRRRTRADRGLPDRPALQP